MPAAHRAHSHAARCLGGGPALPSACLPAWAAMPARHSVRPLGAPCNAVWPAGCRYGRQGWLRDGGKLPRVDTENIEEALNKSLERLGTDYVDLLQVGGGACTPGPRPPIYWPPLNLAACDGAACLGSGLLAMERPRGCIAGPEQLAAPAAPAGALARPVRAALW